jgi:hypothetical protein
MDDAFGEGRAGASLSEGAGEGEKKEKRACLFFFDRDAAVRRGAMVDEC